MLKALVPGYRRPGETFMRQSNVRSLAVLASLVLGLAPGVASAQTPPPPPGYAVTTVALDDVLMPLLVAAEGDASGGARRSRSRAPR